MTLTVILPAAGKGTRLNLPYPKEILRLDKNQALIDYSFDHFKDYDRNSVDFVVVINEWKTDIVGYLSKYRHKYNIAFVYQNPLEREYTGAIKSAYHWFGEDNLVLLPDTILKLKNSVDLYTTVKDRLETNEFVFFYKKESNPSMLSTKGALQIENNLVKLYEDKPQTNIQNYNAYWCSFAFKVSSFADSISYMEKSTLNKKFNTKQMTYTPFYNTEGIEVDDYIDLGTWGEIRKLLALHEGEQ